MKSRNAKTVGAALIPFEDQLQIALADWLHIVRPACLWWHTPNGGWRSRREAGRFKRMGVLSGVPDLVFVGMPKCQIAFIELKTAKGRLSDDQHTFIDRCIELGIPVHVIATDDTSRLITEVSRLLKRWGALP